MKSFQHLSVQSLEEANSALEQYQGGAVVNAGGTDLISLLKTGVLPEYPKALVDIKSIPDLDYIREDGQFLRIGALAKLAELADSELVKSKYSILSQAAHTVASPQIRNIATIGGNICQEVRCWYYRYPENIGGPLDCKRKVDKAPCLALKGDNRYQAVMGGKKCFAVAPSDIAVALIALDAKLVICGIDNERTILMEDFYHSLGNHLEQYELIREIIIPIKESAEFHLYSKFTLRKPIDFAIVSVGVTILMKDSLCTDCRIVLGSVSTSPVRVREAEKILVGTEITLENAKKAADMSVKGAKPLSNNAYKVEIVKSLVQESILKVLS